MEQITIRIQDKQKARRLIDLLKILDFIDSIEADETDITGEDAILQKEEDDFFALAGLWQGRDTSQEIIRKQAWPSRSA
jgi:hypothetical protein